MADEPKPEERARVKQGMHLAINGLVVGVERKTIKNLHLSVYPPDGRVHVSAPLECPDERIRMYVLEKWGNAVPSGNTTAKMSGFRSRCQFGILNILRVSAET